MTNDDVTICPIVDDVVVDYRYVNIVRSTVMKRLSRYTCHRTHAKCWKEGQTPNMFENEVILVVFLPGNRQTFRLGPLSLLTDDFKNGNSIKPRNTVC